jgi:glutathione peroxidase
VAATVYDFEAKDIDGNDVSLGDYEGEVLLIVNVASKCGFTPQYDGLQDLYDEFHDDGFEVLGFPCNQFLNQEPAPEHEIKEFCTLNFSVEFPMFGKIDVNGDDTHPLYQHLKSEAPGMLGSQAIKWNFTKFLVDQNGKVVQRYAPKTTPEEIRDDIVKLLAS